MSSFSTFRTSGHEPASGWPRGAKPGRRQVHTVHSDSVQVSMGTLNNRQKA